MILFLLIFFLVYGGLHGYGFCKAKAALAFDHSVGIPLAIFLLIMVLAPIIVHYLENAGLNNVAKVMAYFSYTWMALIFLFFSASLVVDVYHLILRLGALVISGNVSSLYPSAKLQFFAPLTVSVLIVFYGFFEAANMHTERIVIYTPRIPSSIGKLKIAQISDVHLGLLVGEKKLQKIINQVAALDPDILVSTGDLMDGEICQNGQMAEILNSFNPRYGKYAVTGNHEYYAGVERAVKCMEEGGFKMLRGQTVDLGGIIHIVGVDDPTGKSFHQNAGVSENTLLSGLASRHDYTASPFVLLLKHRPEVDSSSLGLFDLQLSGHTHQGQIFPFSIFTQLVYTNDGGFLKLCDGSHQYVSRGTGTWGPPIRFLAPPEITIIELVHVEENPKSTLGQVTPVSQSPK